MAASPSTGMFSQDALERIKQALPLPSYFMEHEPQLQLRRAGRSYRGRCPFEPGSGGVGKFSVEEDRYHCFGCKRSGTIFTWLEHAQDLSFREAVQHAAELAGVALPRRASSAAARAADVQRQVRRDALRAVAEWTRLEALRLPAPRAVQLPDGEVLPLDLLISTGEVGWFPLDEGQRSGPLGEMPAAVREELGLSETADLGGRWLLWAQDRTGPVAARAVTTDGRPRKVLGVEGPESGGWVTPPSAKGMRLERAAIAADDAMYLRIRGARIGEVVRPIGRAALEGRPPRWLNDPSEPPVLLGVATLDGRRQIAALAQRLLPVNPRLRVLELVPADRAIEDPHHWVRQFRRLLATAGTVLDWQLRLCAERGSLDTTEQRLDVAGRLRPYLLAVAAPFEREVFAAEVAAWTGVAPELLLAPAPDSPAPTRPGRVSPRARTRTPTSGR